MPMGYQSCVNDSICCFLTLQESEGIYENVLISQQKYYTLNPVVVNFLECSVPYVEYHLLTIFCVDVIRKRVGRIESIYNDTWIIAQLKYSYIAHHFLLAIM